MKADVKSFLADLKQANDNNVVSIKVPSTKKKANFKRFNITQHKLLIRSAFDGIEGNIESQNVYNTIIKDNCTDDINFLVYDRSAILLELRKASVGTDFTINDKKYDLNDLKSLDPSTISAETTVLDKEHGLEIHARVPTLELDTKVNVKIIAELKKLTEDQQRKRSIELLLAYEVVKFISTIKLGETELKFEDISMYECINIVNELPMKVNNKILEFITKIRTEETNSLTFDDGTELDIDAGFLTAD